MASYRADVTGIDTEQDNGDHSEMAIVEQAP